MMTKQAHTIIEKLERVGRLLDEGAYRDTLNPAQWDVLRFLGRANRFSRTPRSLTAYLGSTKGTVSQTLAALVKKGLVAKTPSNTDKRQVHLSLTPDGQALIELDPHKDLTAVLDRLPEPDKAVLDKSLSLMITEKITRNGGAAFGLCRHCRYFRDHHSDGQPHFCALLSVPLSQRDSGHICMEQVPA